ncbi:repressor of RNA polymerase III transcription MAF1 homolog [Eurytemora carolleeae]|uniref:repressor of RNA polymerase III transcription MAF1 homolog n=1 Tax=Eurytemora carolleeae TaxID=1294199 RepID=UPI000C78EE20|nr:repressor of RNA polymerase III transcription MAF1 homolog [Eurytemora carolleeae]|eukprot:XP_023321904.1 repressor of RNA polymerase III transcription MAF1 homolog [Eurytemora affinis]
MKLLENSGIEAINNLLCLETGDSKIVGRIESYSCKMIGAEKQQYKKFSVGRDPQAVEALSPPTNGYGGYAFSTSPVSRSYSRSSGSEDEGVGILCDTIARKTLFHLISTLNAAFPDYDFTDARSSEFTKEPNLQFVTSNVDNLLSVAASSLYSKIHDKLWITLNQEINLVDCEIYSYNPDLTSDPFGEEGSLWSFNYFFFNKKLKRVVLFTCRALSPYSQEYYETGMSCEEDMEYSY